MPKKKIKILLVEDDYMIRSMYKTKFTIDGYNVVTADNGVDVIKVAKKEKPDIIMLDVILPQLDGFSALEQIKKDVKTKKIPVVMLTNLSTEEDRIKGKELGVVDYLVKAILTPQDISDKIKGYVK